jgi:hypothetical protein
MSKATIYGFAPNSWVPGPDFRVMRDERGLTTGSQTFYCRKGDFAGSVMQTAFAKGNPIATIYPSVDPLYRFLEIDTAEESNQPGGISHIAVAFVGFRETNAELSREITYTRTSGMEKRPMIEHPDFSKEVESGAERDVIVLAYEGKAFKASYTSGGADIEVVDSLDKIVGRIYSTEGKKWWRTIIDNGKREYEAVTSEWTKSGTNAGGLRNSDLKNLGKLDRRPPGEPATPEDHTWRLIGATESRSTGSASSYSLTWQLMPETYANISLYGLAY